MTQNVFRRRRLHIVYIVGGGSNIYILLLVAAGKLMSINSNKPDNVVTESHTPCTPARVSFGDFITIVNPYNNNIM